MPTYRLSARSQFRTPSGAVGDPPDGPGGMAALSDDVDNFLGVGGAEYAANAAALAAVPAGRRFTGKLVYQADINTVWRYVGLGNTALLGNDTTHPWQAWEKPATAFTPAWGALTVGSSTQVALWGITNGRFWADLYLTAGTGYALTASTDVVLTLPSPVAVQLSSGAGFYSPTGLSSSGSMIPLQPYTVGTVGASGTAVRVRAPQVSGTLPQTPKLVYLATAVGTAATTDQMQLSLSAPSALVA